MQDKLWLPGLLKLQMLSDTGFFGEILSVRGEFGYWVFEGDVVPAQRPSWNYRKEDGGGIIIDMLCHWRYVLDNLFGPSSRSPASARRTSRKRWDEKGKPYDVTADDCAYATFELEGGIVAHFNSSWSVARPPRRPPHDPGGRHEGLGGRRAPRVLDPAATATRRSRSGTPTSRSPSTSTTAGCRCPSSATTTTPSRSSGSCSCATSSLDEPFRLDLLEGAKGVQLAELGLESWKERRWLDVPALV